MSLVGPRPTVQVQVDRYTERQRGRLDVRPGITGWAQVNGRASLPWHERIELDLWYVEHASLRARPADHVAEPADGVRRPRALPRRDRRLARAARSDVLGDLLRALVDVARAERPDRVEDLVVHLRAGDRVRPRRGGDLRRSCRSCSRTAACGSRRPSRPAAPRAGRRSPSACPACTGSRCGRARAGARACRGSACRPGRRCRPRTSRACGCPRSAGSSCSRRA